MVIGIRNIESTFHRQRKKVLKNLEQIERKKRRQFSHVAKELDKFRRREAVLKKIEQKTSSHLKQVNKKISSLKKRDVYDKRRIKQMVAEIKRLKKEIPKLEARLKSSGISRVSVAREERKFAARLSKVSSRVREIERRKNKVEKDLQRLLAKERMLKEGRIYWSSVNRKMAKVKQSSLKIRSVPKKARRIKARLTVRPKRYVPQKRGIIERILFHPKNR